MSPELVQALGPILVAAAVAGVGGLLKHAISQFGRKLEEMATDVKALMHVVGDHRGDIRSNAQHIDVLKEEVRRLWARMDDIEGRLDDP